MPAPTAIQPYSSLRHHWHLSFDRVVCRTCDAHLTDDNADETCAGAAKIRPVAGMRNPIKPDFRQHFKPDLSAHPKLKKAWDRWQADRGRA